MRVLTDMYRQLYTLRTKVQKYISAARPDPKKCAVFLAALFLYLYIFYIMVLTADRLTVWR